jgi:hypothetical protein
MGKDLGTYHVEVNTSHGGFIYRWNTNGRFTHGTVSVSPMNAAWIPPSWDDEEDLISTIIFMFTEGNYSCDCNLQRFLDNSKGITDGDYECGDDIELISLTLIRPDGSKRVLELESEV